ncbi:MAG: hypothetical protein MUW56_22545 [Chryseobacterium sp.]|uniref:hypothetical protein n=1 Tax=Chryseobacterium sp. TaxID=1871047 RepID=UPI0025B87B89|nr:hypothetical protein [Chryseobacterium sp.]MCJ7936335.1 hypothetical protein [Chryseobacterium sp.]
MKKIFFVSAIALSLCSCRENKPENPVADNAVDMVESSVSTSFKSNRNNEKTVDNIYSEFIRKDKNLSDFNSRIVKTFEESEKVLTEYRNILNTSAYYYQDAGYQVKNINDSLVKQQIEKEIQVSADRYDLKMKATKDRITQITQNNETLTSLYTVFKIRKTLPEIEKYQNAHSLKTDSLDSFLKKQNKLLEELKNLK